MTDDHTNSIAKIATADLRRSVLDANLTTSTTPAAPREPIFASPPPPPPPPPDAGSAE